MEAQKIFSCVYRMDQRFGSTLIAQVLRGSKNKRVLSFGLNRLSTYGIMSEYTEKELRLMISILISQGYLMLTQSQYPIVKLTQNSIPVLKGKGKVYMAVEKQEKRIEDKNTFYMDLFENLRKLRKNLSQERNVPPYVIFSDATLREMSANLPSTKVEFLKIKGVGQKKYESYGEIFMGTIRIFMEERDIAFIEKTDQPKTYKRSNKTPSHQESFALYKEGKTIEEIAKIRSVKKDTILTHLIKCQQEGEKINWQEIIDDKIEKIVLEAVEQVGTQYLKPIKELVPEDISYYDIKLVLSKIKYA